MNHSAHLLSKALAVVVLLLASAAFADSLSITQFGGVDFSINELRLQPGQATQCVNWDLSKGTLIKRDGYSVFSDTTDTTAGFTGLYGYTDQDGNKRLFATYQTEHPWDYVGYTDEYGDSISNHGFRYWYKNSTPSWAIYNDKVIIGNGYNDMLRWNKAGIEPLVENPPGSFRMAPVVNSNSIYFLDGDYYYSWSAKPYFASPPDYSTRMSEGEIQAHVDSGHIVLYAPPHCGAYRDDADTLVPSTENDSTIIKVLRTRAGMTPRDSFFTLFACTVEHDASMLYWIDSIPDDSLGNAVYAYGGIPDTGYAEYTADTTTHHEYRLGQPQWLGTDTVPSTGGIWDGISEGMKEYDSVWSATRYYVLYYDSSTRMASIPGPYVRIPVVNYIKQYWDGGTSFSDTGGCTDACDSTHFTLDSIRDYSIGLGLPPVPPEKDHLWRLLCRAREDERRETVHDTLFYDNATPAIYVARIGAQEINSYACRENGILVANSELLFERDPGGWMCRGSGFRAYDTTISHIEASQYWILDTIKNASDSIYVDSASWGGIADFPRTLKSISELIGPSHYPTIHDNRLYIADGNTIRASDPFKIAMFSAGSSFDVSPDDGDEITGMLSTEQGLLVFKNKSQFVAEIISIDEDGDVVHGATKIRDLGCIAPGSILSLPQGGYAFLSDVGVQAYSTHYQSLYKSSGGNFGEISKPIKVALDAYDIDDLRECNAWLTDDYKNLVFSFPPLDTSWVYSLSAGQWGAWNFAPRQTTRYDTTYQTDLRPSDNVLFIGNSSDSIYKYGGVKTDADEVVRSQWVSGPLFLTSDFGKIVELGAWKNGSDAITDDVDSIIIGLIDQDGNTEIAIVDSANTLYKRYEINPEEGNYFKFYIQAGGTIDSLAVLRADLWWKFTSGAMKH